MSSEPEALGSQLSAVGCGLSGGVGSASIRSAFVKMFLYLHAADLGAMRAFYSDVVGLDEIHADDGTVGYRCGSAQITLESSSDAETVAEWSKQLGWSGGTGSDPSWGFELDAETFEPAVRRVRASGAELMWEQPRWVGYWSFPVRDPGGNTVEISCPDREAWSGST